MFSGVMSCSQYKTLGTLYMLQLCWMSPVLDTVIVNTLQSLLEVKHAFTTFTEVIAQRNIQYVIHC